MPTPQAVCEYKRIGKLPLYADVFHPGTKRPPVLLYLHGGALIGGNRDGLAQHHIDAYTGAGLAVISVDYRLAPQAKIAAIRDDIEDAMAWARGTAPKIFNLDGSRLFVAGSSAGGYLSLLAGTLKVKPKAIVAFYGYGDILGPWMEEPYEFYRTTRPMVTREAALKSVRGGVKAGGTKRNAFYLYCRQQGVWPQEVTGLDPATQRRQLREFCPAYNVTPDSPPTLMLHGDDDTDVPLGQSRQMARALKKHGVTHELIVVKDGPHGFDYDTNDARNPGYMQRVTQFLKAHGA